MQKRKRGGGRVPTLPPKVPKIPALGHPFSSVSVPSLLGRSKKAAGHIPESTQKTAQTPEKALIAGKSANQRVDVPIFQKLVLFRGFAPFWRARIGHRLSIRKPHQHTFRPGIRPLTGPPRARIGARICCLKKLESRLTRL